METTAGFKAADGSNGPGVSADREHEAGTSGSTEAIEVGASTNPDGSRVGALTWTVSKGADGLGSKEGKEVEVDSRGEGELVKEDTDVVYITDATAPWALIAVGWLGTRVVRTEDA